MADIPDRCPVCNKGKKYLLAHLGSKLDCSSKIDSALIDKWRKIARKRTQQNCQKKYIKSGKHKLAQAKYVKKCEDEDKESFLKIQKQKQAKYHNIRRFEVGKPKKRYKVFEDLCIKTLYSLKKGETPLEAHLMKFQLVEDELCKKYVDITTNQKVDPNVAHSWLNKVSPWLLKTVVTFQRVALIPRSNWLKAISEVERNEEKKYLRDKLFKLIGKLQAYNHENTKSFSVPEEFKSGCLATTKDPWVWYPMPEKFSIQDRIDLIKLLRDIIEGGCIKDPKMRDLLRLSKQLSNLDEALKYSASVFINRDDGQY